MCVEPVLEAPCSNSSIVSNCSAFAECADAAYPCSRSYFRSFFQPFCNLQNKTTDAAQLWLSSATGCLTSEVLDFFNTSYTPCPAPSECNQFQISMFHSQKTCFNQSLCETPFSPDDAQQIGDVIAMSGQLRDRNLEQLLELASYCGANNTLVTAIKDEGFVHCLLVRLNNESATDAGMRLLSKLESEIEEKALINSSLSYSSDVTLCPPIPPALHGNEVAVLAYVNTGDGAISRYRLCENTDNISDATVYCPVCGDGVVQLPFETCDDDNVMGSDGCNMNCSIEDGHDCNPYALPTDCHASVCGDGIRIAGEKCDVGTDGPGCSDESCLVIQGFVCDAPFFNRSVCFSCGNGIVETPEECDNGLSGVVDGCNNTCHVERFFECTGGVGELSVCQHVAIDFNVPDQTTLDPSVITFTQPDVEIFLVETPEFLDATKIGNEVL